MVFHGWITPTKMDQIYRKTSIVFRVPVHDGLSMMVLEALAKGKHVFYKYDFPYCIKADSFAMITKALSDLCSKPPSQNIEGHRYIISHFNKDKIAQQFIQYFKSIS